MNAIAGEIRTTAAAAELVLVDGKPPERVQLLRMGENAAREGARRFVVADRAHAEEILAATSAYLKSTDAMIDYDHQSVYGGAKKGVGGRAAAAGWMTKLSAEDDGIYADVEWTRAASAALGDREYRYISPYFGHRADGRVTRIFNAALTNTPELELRAAASLSDPDIIEDTDPMTGIAAALGLAAGASEADIVAAITKITADRAAACSALGLASTATVDEIRTAAAAPDPARFAPIGELTALRQRLDAIDEERVTAGVDAAITAGKIRPAKESRDWALSYAKRDPAGFAAYVAMTPEIVGQGPEERRAAAIKTDTLTAEEKATCAATGMSEENYLKERKRLENAS